MKSQKTELRDCQMESDRKVTQSRNPCPCNARSCIPVRYMVGVFLMFGCALFNALRFNLSMAIAVMVGNNTVLREGREIQETAEFSWSTKLQGITLSAFYFGYILMHIPGGWLAHKFGGARVFGVCVGVTGTLTLFTPLAARMHVGMLILLRIAMGLAEAPTFPAGHAFWSKWSPPLERSKLVTFNFAGANLGTITTMFLSGYLAFNYGWPSIFYVFGTGGVIWAIIWLLLVRNSPSEQLRISSEEVEYIELSLAADIQKKNAPIPWKSIFSSLPMWAIVVANFTQGWSGYTMLSELPLFYTQRLDLDLKETSVASSVPFVVLVLVLLFGGQLADYLRKHFLNTGTVRKIFNTLGFIFPAVFLLAASFTYKPDRVVALIILGVGLNGLAYIGFGINHLDIAPPFASILYGISDMGGSLAGILTPTLTGFIVQHHTAVEWRIVFIINGTVLLLGGTFYVVFGSGEKQSWATNSEYDNLTQDDSDDSDWDEKDRQPLTDNE